MARRSRIPAGRAFVEINADDSKFVRALKRAEARLKSFGFRVGAIGRRLAALGGVAVGGLVAMTVGFARAGDQLDKMSARTGVSVDALGELGFAAEQSGSSMESLGNAFQRMNRRLGRITAGLGSSEQVKAMEALGLSAEELAKLSPEERFLAIAEAMAAMEDPAEAAGLAQRAFGTAVDDILPLLLQGREGIQALRDEARELGFTLTESEASGAAAFTDAMNKLKRTVTGVSNVIGAQLAPALTKVGEVMAIIVSRGIDFIRNNRAMVTATFAVAVGVTAFGVSLIGLQVAIKATAFAMGGLLKVMALAKVAFAILTSPITLVVVAVAAAIAAFVAFTDAGNKMVATLVGKFRTLGDIFRDTLGGITDALTSGDVALAANIFWLGLKAAWLEGTRGLREVWNNFLTGFQAAFTIVLESVRALWAKFVSGLSKVVIRIQGFFDDDLNVDRAIESIDEQLSDKLDGIAEDLRDKLEDIGRDGQDAVQAIRDEIAAARAELADLRRDARDRPAVGDGEGAPTTAGFPGVGSPAEALRGASSSRGIFNIRALQSLRNNPTIERQLRAAEKTAENTRRTVEALEDQESI